MKICIIGSGITGMMAANKFAQNGHNVTVFEKSLFMGGLLRTINIDGFRFDIGGHWLHYESFNAVQNMFANLVKHTRNAFVHLNDIDGRFPVQEYYEDVFSSAECKIIEKQLTIKHDVEPKTYDDMLRLSYGEKLYETFFRDYNAKLFGTDDLKSISYGKYEVIRNVRVGDKSGYNYKFSYPDGAGIYSLIEDLHHNDVHYLTNNEVVNIKLDDKLLWTVDGTMYSYDLLVSTMPLKELVEIADISSDIKEKGSTLRGSAGLVLNMGIKKRKGNENKTWVYYPDKNLPFYRVGFYSNVDKSAAPDGYDAIYVEVSTDAVYSIHDIVQQLESVGVIGSSSDIVALHEVRLPLNYCYTNKHTEAILEALEKKNVYSIGRYGAWHWSSMHEDIQQAIMLADKVGDA